MRFQRVGSVVTATLNKILFPRNLMKLSCPQLELDRNQPQLRRQQQKKKKEAAEALVLLPEPQLGADLDSLASIDGFQADVRPASDLDLLALPTRGIDDLRGLEGASFSQSSGTEQSVKRQTGSGAEAQPETLAEATILLNTTDRSDEVDVMAELVAIAKKSEDAETESALNLGEAGLSANAPKQPAFSILTFPMLQTQRLPLATVPRARKPLWKLRLMVSEGFAIDPAEPVDITIGTMGTWRISRQQLSDPNARETKPESPKVIVVVQVQVLGNRGNSLRWKVAAVPEDMPQVFFPMGQPYLDLIHSSLSGSIARLRSSIESLTTFSKASGLPSAVRSRLGKERQGYESQLEFVSRLHAAAAEANLVEGWLDGQIEVHAQFYDSAAPDSTPILQFGE